MDKLNFNFEGEAINIRKLINMFDWVYDGTKTQENTYTSILVHLEYTLLYPIGN